MDSSFKYSVTYIGPLGGQRVEEITKWLKIHVGVRYETWRWNSYTISFLHEADAIIFKLKFEL